MGVLIAIGASWGGLRALSHLLAELDEDLSASVVVVQHRRSDSPRDAMVAVLEAASSLPVKELEDKDPIEVGNVYLAPADYHVIVEPGHFALSTEDLVDHARPSIDVMFESAADSYGAALIAVVLTGMKADGSRGLSAVKRNGGRVIAQHPDSAERADMPEAAIATGLVDEVVPLGEMAAMLNRLVASHTEGSFR